MTASVSESVGGEILGYEGSSGYSEYNSTGGKKKKSRRRSRKMYGGNDEVIPNPLPKGGMVYEPPTGGMGEEVPGVGSVGGRRRHRRGKTHKGKMYKGKTRKGKVSKWITHVKNFSRANKMDFRDALKDPRCKATYHKMK